MTGFRFPVRRIRMPPAHIVEFGNSLQAGSQAIVPFCGHLLGSKLGTVPRQPPEHFMAITPQILIGSRAD